MPNTNISLLTALLVRDSWGPNLNITHCVSMFFFHSRSWTSPGLNPGPSDHVNSNDIQIDIQGSSQMLIRDPPIIDFGGWRTSANGLVLKLHSRTAHRHPLGDTGRTCKLHTERPFCQPHPGYGHWWHPQRPQRESNPGLSKCEATSLPTAPRLILF